MSDLVSRSELKKKLTPIKLFGGAYCKAITEKDIDDAPTVELTETEIQEVLNKRCMTAVANEYLIVLHGGKKSGEWINDFDRLSCPFCKMSIDDEVHYLYPKEYGFNYCPNCGAKLRIGGNENE